MKTFSFLLKLVTVCGILLLSRSAFAANKSSTTDGNWSDPNTWSPSGVPDAADNVTIRGGDTVTVDGVYTCANVTIGNATTAGACLKITSASNSLTINGALAINPNNRAYTYNLDAGPGTVNVAGTFTSWSTSGTNKFTIGTGTLTFTPAMTIASTNQSIVFTDAGTVNFNGAFTDQRNKLTTYAGCTVNFASSYTVNTTNANWASKGTAVFTGTACTVTPTTNITFNDVQVAASKAVTLNTGAGTVIIGGSVTLASGSTFTASKDFQLSGSWTNNGGTYSGTGYTITLNGTSNTIGGTTATAFGHITVGKSGASAVAVSYTMNTDASCVNMSFDGNTQSRTFALASGKTLAISGTLTINQPSTAAMTNMLDVGAGICTVAGDLNYDGTSITTNKVAKVNVTTGSFTVTGAVDWMANAVVQTEVLAVSTGTVNFGSSVSMLTGSGTLQTTGAATMNFNGSSGASLTFGGGVAPVFTTTSGTTLNFANGYTNVVTSPSFASGTNVQLGSSSNPVDLTIDAGTTVTNNGNAIVYGNLTSSSATTFINAANATLEVKGSISDNVTLTATASGNTVEYSGGGAQTIKATTYNNLTLDSTGAKTFASGTTVNGTLTVQGDATVTNTADLNFGTGFVYNSSLPSTITGDLTISGTKTLSNTGAFTIDGKLIYTSNATSTLGNDITAKGITLSAGTLNDGGKTITINNSDGWVNNGGAFTSTGTVAFTGSVASSIAGSAATTFKNLTINNSAGVTLNLSPAAATLVSGELTLTSGVVNSTSSNPLKLTSTATSTAGSASSYVNGPMVKVGNTDFTFPVGKSGKWMRAGVSGMTSPTTEISGEYFAVPYADITTFDASITQVSPIEYWNINRTVTSDPVKVKLYWENAAWSDIANCDLLTIAHFTGGMWIEEPATASPNSSCSWGWGGQGAIETDGTVSTFSPFGFGGGGGGGGLPVKLVSFDAVPNANTVHTTWITELEINNSHFIVERSADGVEFIEVARVEGNGNSTVAHTYESVDNNPLKGTSYYRLRQVDFDGTKSYSQVVPVTFTQPTESVFHVYPNPTDNEMFLNVSNPTDEISVVIYDLSGRKMFAQVYPVTKGKANQTITIQAKYLLPTGVYMLTATTNGVEHRERMILN